MTCGIIEESLAATKTPFTPVVVNLCIVVELSTSVCALKASRVAVELAAQGLELL